MEVEPLDDQARLGQLIQPALRIGELLPIRLHWPHEAAWFVDA